jgi:hypothetical protein
MTRPMVLRWDIDVLAMMVPPDVPPCARPLVRERRAEE